MSKPEQNLQMITLRVEKSAWEKFKALALISGTNGTAWIREFILARAAGREQSFETERSHPQDGKIAQLESDLEALKQQVELLENAIALLNTRPIQPVAVASKPRSPRSPTSYEKLADSLPSLAPLDTHCPDCGSTELRNKGRRGEKQRWQCKDCSKNFSV